MSAMSLRAATLSVLLGTALLGTGAAQAATVAGSTVADAVAEKLSASTKVKVTKMTCPDEVDVRKGERITCQGRFESGDKTPVRVTLTSDQGAFKARIVNLLMRHLEDQLEAAINVKTKVTCPKTRKVKKGDRFTCKVKATNGDKGTFKITQTGDGLVRYKLA